MEKKDSAKENIFHAENHIRVTVEDLKNKSKYIDEECCTCINILLNKDGSIATSFLGVHNDDIIKALEKAQKIYFKKLKNEFKNQEKKLKESTKKYNSIKIKNKKLNKTFDENNNDYSSATAVSADTMIKRNKKKKDE